MKQELQAAIDKIIAQPTLSAAETDTLMNEAFALASTPEEKKEAMTRLRDGLRRRKRHDVDVRSILGDAAPYLNLAQIAKQYFDKDRTWLYQRINQAKVNGKPVAFTDSELRILSDSLQEISNIIHQTSINLTHQV